MGKVLSIFEVSQKQAYIFGVNKLKENIRRSAEIAKITSTEYIENVAGPMFLGEENLVYSGGGHIILEFNDASIDKALEKSKSVTEKMTGKILRDLPEIEFFAASTVYEEDKTPGENVKNLIAALERKKSVRRSVFHQYSFGVEVINTDTGLPRAADSQKTDSDMALKEEVSEAPEGFAYTSSFDRLGGSKNDKNFIAIVHIDGNAMGKQVEKISEEFRAGEWEEYKNKMQEFSNGISRDYSAAYKVVEDTVAKNIREGNLSALDLTGDEGKTYLPVRRIINEGDDICFVSEGRIGLECAAVMLSALGERGYAACAGVALVHQKYPFYKAYELAEELCSNAKRLGVQLAGTGSEDGPKLSSIDWHVEYGEIQDSLEDTRKMYFTRDKKHLELRPYIVETPLAPEYLLEKEQRRRYKNFKKLTLCMIQQEDFYGRSVLKGLRPVLKQGETALTQYLTVHKITDLGRDAYYGIFEDIDYSGLQSNSGKQAERKYFVETSDGEERSVIFDAIEIMDVFLPMGGE